MTFSPSSSGCEPPSVPSGRMRMRRPCARRDGDAGAGVATTRRRRRHRRRRRSRAWRRGACRTGRRRRTRRHRLPQVGHSRAADERRAASPAVSPGDGDMPSAGDSAAMCAERVAPVAHVPRLRRRAWRAVRRAGGMPPRRACGAGVSSTRTLPRAAARRRRSPRRARRRSRGRTCSGPGCPRPQLLHSRHQVISTRRSCWPRKT